MLHLSFGGAAYVQPTVGGSAIVELDFATQKARSLFLYLGLTLGRQHSRRALSALFWPDAPEPAAANSLRQTLHRIRALLAQAGVDPGLVHASAQTVALAASPAIAIDCLAVQQSWKQCSSHTHRGIDNCTICARRLVAAAELITAPPLNGLQLPDAPEFELWLAGQQEQIMASTRQLLQALATYHANGGEVGAALDYVRQWLALEPWQEEAHYLAIQLLAVQGNRAAALRQYQQCQVTLEAELGIPPDGRLLQLRAQIAAGNLPELAAPQLFHAPFAHLPLWGRQADWQLLEEILNNPANRLVTILGMGGAGKTQLALAISRALARLFRDGAWYISLDSVTNELQFQAAVAVALGIALSSGQPLEDQLLQFLARRNLLLLLDGSEHLTHTAPFLAKILRQCPGVTLLVTSRVRLDLRAEHVLLLEGLPVPTTLAGRDPDADDSLTHFVHAAQRLDPAFALTPANGAAVYEICHLLDGLPLAVELTAAQITNHSCQELAQALHTSLDLAAASWIDAPPRQRSWRASFEVSWHGLAPELQQLLSTLTVFDGTFAADAATAVLRATLAAGYVDAVLNADMERLVNASLLRRTTTGRYSLHAAVRAFALEQLATSDPHKSPRLVTTRTAHLRYFTSWLQAHDPSYAGDTQKQCLERIDLETGNLVAAWGWAIEMQDWAALDSLASPLHAANRIRGRHEESAHLLEQAIDALHAQTPPASLLATPAGQLHCQVLAHLSILRGDAAYLLSQRPLARVHGAEAVRCIQCLGAERQMQRDKLEANYWCLECSLALQESNWPQLAKAAHQGLAVLPTVGAKRLRGLLLGYAGVAAQGRGQNQAAIRAMTEAIALLSGSDGDHWRAAGHRSNLASTLLLTGQEQEAARFWQESYAYLRAIGDLAGAATALDNLAFVELTAHNNAQAAIELCLEALALVRQTGLPGREANILNSLGVIALKVGDLPAACEHQVASLRVALEFNLTADIMASGGWLAIALLLLGRQTEQAAAFLCAVLNSPLLHAEIRQLLQEALAASPQQHACADTVAAGATVALAEHFDWPRAAAALAGLPMPELPG